MTGFKKGFVEANPAELPGAENAKPRVLVQAYEMRLPIHAYGAESVFRHGYLAVVSGGL